MTEEPADQSNGCCAPSRAGPGENEPATFSRGTSEGSTAGMVLLEGGEFAMGTDHPIGYPGDGEGPVRQITLAPFWIDERAVTNEDFAAFVDESGYVTEAESFDWSFVFAGLLPDEFPDTRAVAHAPWWRQVHSADWQRPEGPQSSNNDRSDHPVLHVSWNDAQAYCVWAGKRLPTEAEWEYAARGGLEQKIFPWGDELEPGGEHLMNVWQGAFPSDNAVADGHYGTAPVDEYPANGYGLSNMTGNVWEWCADWFHPDFHSRGKRSNPTGPTRGQNKVTRGGSYLCHESYCRRYRVSARNSLTPDSSTGNTGFRCVRDTTEMGTT